MFDATHDRSWTVTALSDLSRSFTEHLFRYEAGERIAFRLPNGPEWFGLFLALQRAGLAAIPLDGGMPQNGCLDIARNLGARAIYIDGGFHALNRTRGRKRKCCCVKLTSGTGSHPKAIECRAEHLLADGRNVVKTMGIRSRDINLAAIPLGHSYGLGNLVMPLIIQGTAMVSAQEYVPRQLLDWIDRYQVTVFPTVPAILRVLASIPADQIKLDSLRTVISAGAVLTPTVAQAFFDRYGIKVHNFYGSSETGGICYDRTGTASLTGRSVGKPFSGVSISVRSRRILVEGAAVATRSGSWRMPDFGEWNSRKELVLLGRGGKEANIGGKKVHPLEIDRVLRSLSDVTDAAVWLEQIHGRDFLVAAVETIKSRASIERELTAQLPAWKMPREVFVMRELPRTGRGKIDLGILKKAFQGRR